MPIKNQTSRSHADIEKAVKRFMGGEQAVALAREFGISKPGFYLWVKKFKAEQLERSKTSGMSPRDAATADKRTLILEVEALKLENRKLRDSLLSKMLKLGEL